MELKRFGKSVMSESWVLCSGEVRERGYRALGPPMCPVAGIRVPGSCRRPVVEPSHPCARRRMEDPVDVHVSRLAGAGVLAAVSPDLRLSSSSLGAYCCAFSVGSRVAIAR